MPLSLHIVDKKQCYSQGDSFHGFVTLTTRAVTHVAKVITTFKATNIVSSNASQPREYFNISTTLYENDKRQARPLLQPGRHAWCFEYMFPKLDNLPLSFAIQNGGFAADAFRESCCGHCFDPALAIKDWDTHAFVIYHIEVRIISDDLKERKTKQTLNFSPHRLTLLEDGLGFYQCRISPTKYFLRIPTGSEERRLVLVLYLPRYAVIGETLPLHLSAEYVKSPLRSSSGSVLCRLKSFQIMIHSTTKIGPNPSAGSHTVLVEDYCGPFGKDLGIELEPGARTDLRTLYPTFKLSPNLKLIRSSGAVAATHSPIVPTFDVADISRVYRISLTSKMKFGKRTLIANFLGRELVVLPNRVRPEMSCQPQELDPVITRVEAPEILPELGHDGARVEADTEGREVGERFHDLPDIPELRYQSWPHELHSHSQM
ncbi:hypothetical protein MMC17_009031 [Xylographa soralifera]|nr:hypothetical protein [Xylographa soralifera]